MCNKIWIKRKVKWRVSRKEYQNHQVVLPFMYVRDRNLKSCSFGRLSKQLGVDLLLTWVTIPERANHGHDN